MLIENNLIVVIDTNDISIHQKVFWSFSKQKSNLLYNLITEIIITISMPEDKIVPSYYIKLSRNVTNEFSFSYLKPNMLCLRHNRNMSMYFKKVGQKDEQSQSKEN